MKTSRAVRRIRRCRSPGMLPGSQGEDRLIVEHLLEVRHEPALIRRIPVESEPHMVVYASLPHRFKGSLDHREGEAVVAAVSVAQQETDIVRHGELRRIPKPPRLLSKRSGRRRTPRPGSFRRGRQSGCLHQLAEVLYVLAAGGEHFFASAVPSSLTCGTISMRPFLPYLPSFGI